MALFCLWGKSSLALGVLLNPAPSHLSGTLCSGHILPWADFLLLPYAFALTTLCHLYLILKRLLIPGSQPKVTCPVRLSVPVPAGMSLGAPIALRLVLSTEFVVNCLCGTLPNSPDTT